MKRNMIACIRAISGDDFDTLEEIIEYKYRKFCDVYWLIREYTDYITRLAYKDRQKKNSLKIEFEVAGIKSENVFDDIKDRLSEYQEASVSKSGKAIVIEIFRDE